MFLWVERIRNHGLVRSRADAIHMCDATCMAFTPKYLLLFCLCVLLL